MPFGVAHPLLRYIAQFATTSFYSRIEVINGDQVPEHGPVIVLSNHHNSAVDPSVLSIKFPHGRMLHYWAKSTLFTNKIAGSILRSAGNLAVDRKTRDNALLFASTFDVLKQGECVALFPEGTSATLPGLLPQLKDGASWAALEYHKNVREKGRLLSNGIDSVDEDPQELTICLAGISYTDKSKYRSAVVMEFGPSFNVGPFLDEFEVDPKAAAKRMTKHIAEALTKLTVNAPDWDSLHAATMARKMLWVDDRSIPLRHLVQIGQTLVDLFATRTPSPELRQLTNLLLAYHKALRDTSFTHYSLSGVPLPDKLDPNNKHDLPTRMRVLGHLLLSTGKAMLRLPFFAAPLIVHMPIYLMGKYSLRFSDLQEDHAQNKIAVCLVLSMATYVTLFFLAWAFLFIAPYGFILAAIFVWLFAVYHNSLVDDNYLGAKKVVASWRVLVGIWSAHAKHETLHQIHSLQRRFPSTSISNGFSSETTSTNQQRTSTEAMSMPLLHEDNVSDESNPIRRVLSLRVEASAALGEFLLGDEEGKRVARRLEEWGAKVRKVRKEVPAGQGAGSVRLE
ncbi:BZ3500_MvSof-1268-A1-R1_Chr12-1g03675 [Microbotryum saponariae]|uniref:BZ3500_MvSof-1268-A1-R1_Chr12-1g03675 protein n=1 Tax=Microbotryum saponariae TaxID=289078 RepID=A0A2X0LFN4_9BASI|nr:BZ3500_MvSof-1268-A1-R1_Chr12-1g03675 [Microbotryum saponariae]SDA05268.1 BZ3501_MvSof-1269-A2-R1_Chr12-1g03252 [Microbotryum saponariae]